MEVITRMKKQKDFSIKDIILFGLFKRSNFTFLDSILDEVKNK